MYEKEFNLLHEPWILVMKPDGTVEEVSLLELFRRAPQWRGLAGELPTQDVAVLRLLLAILHAVFSRYDSDENYAPLTSPATALKRWKVIWDLGEFPIRIIEDYLLHFEDRFWLFHPEHPFYQVVLHESVKDYSGRQIMPTEKEVGFLIGDVVESNNKTRLFSNRTQKESVPFSEAARWLLNINSFDVAPGGTPAKSGITIKGFGLSWLSKLGLIWANGANLFETLMLNFVIATKETVWDECSAIWVQDKIYDSEDLKDIFPVFPQNPCGLLTMQFRLIQLVQDKKLKHVTKFLLWSGQSLETKNAFLEQMTIWQKIEKIGVVPKMHDASRQMWRDFSAILYSAPETQPMPGVVAWIAWLKNDNILKLPFVRLDTASITYKKGTAPTHIFTDNLSVNLSFFTSCNEDWVSRIISEIQIVDMLVEQIVHLSQNLSKAAGNKDGLSLKNAANTAKEQAYFRLDMPFRKWLEAIDPERDEMVTVCDQWWEQARRIILDLGKELVGQAGPQAFAGRIITANKKEQRYTAPEAFNRFLYYTSTRDALKGGK